MKLHLILLVTAACPAFAQTGDFTRWTLVQDPPNALLTASATTTAATLNAGNGSIPLGTDIGYLSVNGQTADTSTAGYAFPSANSFTIAIDFDLALTNSPTINLGLGFGVGIDRDGKNSAGAGLLTQNAAQATFLGAGFGAAARINDVNQPQGFIFAPASTGGIRGSLFVTYNAANGNITLGASPNKGAASPAGTATYSGIRNSWPAGNLVVSFFIRSDVSGWQTGNAVAVFSNYRVLAGRPVEIAPRVLAAGRTGDLFTLDFQGGSGWTYYLVGGGGLGAFPDNLTLAPGTTIVENPAGSGIFKATVNVAGKGPRYFLRATSANPAP